MLRNRDLLIDILLLMGAYIVSILIINPVGDFPLNDDWSFARAVKGLVEQGDWRPTDWTSMPLITQALWGTVFCLPAGFSFNALRLSTLTLAIVGIVAVYVLFITNNRGRLLAITAALTLGFNPIYYELSATFMTDVPFSALAILSSIFFVQCIRRFNYLDLSIACALALAATLCRQLGLFLPLAFAVALVVQRGFAIRWLVRAIVPSIVCVVALLLFQQWMSNTGRMPALYGALADPQRRSMSMTAIGFNIVSALLYLGLFCLPILILGRRNLQLITNNTILCLLPALSGGVFALLSIYLIFAPLAQAHPPRWMPTVGNILLPQGLGPLPLRGSVDHLPYSFWGIVTALSVVGGVLLVRGVVASSAILIQKMRSSDLSVEDIIGIFFLAAMGAYMLPIVAGGLYDRYLVPLVPFLLYINTGGEPPQKNVGATIRNYSAAVLIVFFAAFAVLGTRDYLTWNRVRWEALAELQQTSRVSAHDIDGGFDYNGWFFLDPIYRDTVPRIFWNENARHVIAFSQIRGFKIVKDYEYFNWMPATVRKLVLLERETGS